MFNVNAFVGYLFNDYLLGGVIVTLALTLATMTGGLVFGLILAMSRMSKNQLLSKGAYFYIWVFRGTPLLVQLVIVYTALPQLGIRFGVVSSVLIALVMNETAYLAEIIRAGFLGVPQGQREAAMAIGLSRWQTLRLVLMPQLMRLIVPPLGNSVNGLLKATSLASVISMDELMRRTTYLMQERFEVLELYTVAAIYYLVLTTGWNFVQGWLERRYARGYATAAGAEPKEIGPSPLIAEVR